MLKKLRRRFVCITMSIIFCMLMIILGMILYFTMSDLEAKSDAMLQTLTQTPYNRPARISLPYFIIESNSRGEILTAGNAAYDFTDREWIGSIITIVNSNNATSGRIDNLKYVIENMPGIQKICFLDISSYESSLYTLLQICSIIGILSLFVFAFLSILLARWAVKPVDIAWQQQKQFISDASHELKTPLTVIISNAELLQDKNTVETDKKQLTDNILASSQQMRHLVNSMLELARADNGKIRTSFSNVNLSQIVQNAVLQFEPVFYENSLSLQSQIHDPITIEGSEQHLHQLIDILLDNAKKYSAPGIVHVELLLNNRNRCLLTVSNPGDPIPKKELDAIFRRFYRSEQARSDGGSFGLGLAIADRIVKEHNGAIWADSNESGNIFYVELPLN